MKNKKQKWIIIVLGLLLVLAVGSLFVRKENQKKLAVDTSAVEWNGKKGQKKESESETIAIPGYEKINFVKNESKQAVNFHNPKTNTCYFKLSLIHPDGTLLWTSELIEPGKGLYQIELNSPLEEGDYEDAILKYECFTLEDQSPLNGSEINLTISVS